jgi:succinate-acetate transporter protein
MIAGCHLKALGSLRQKVCFSPRSRRAKRGGKHRYMYIKKYMCIAAGHNPVDYGGIMTSKDVSVERKASFAPAGPVALITLGFYVSLLWPLATGVVDGSYAGILVPIGAIIAIVQLICGVIELRNGALLGGTVSLAFSCFMCMGSGEALLKIHGLMPLDSGPIDGYIMLIMGLCMAIFSIVAVRAPLIVFVFYLANALFFTPVGIGNIFNLSALVNFGLVSMAFVCPLAIWIAVAQILAIEIGKPVFWLGKPLLKA